MGGHEWSFCFVFGDCMEAEGTTALLFWRLIIIASSKVSALLWRLMENRKQTVADCAATHLPKTMTRESYRTEGCNLDG
jgi:hypothetical protein